MEKQPRAFDSYVIDEILSTNKFGILEVKELESLKSIFFVREDYAKIEKLITTANVEAIKMILENQPRTEEYLDIMEFKDQNDGRFIVTIYDSNLLEQNPQVIEIYHLLPSSAFYDKKQIK